MNEWAPIEDLPAGKEFDMHTSSCIVHFGANGHRSISHCVINGHDVTVEEYERWIAGPPRSPFWRDPFRADS